MLQFTDYRVSTLCSHVLAVRKSLKFSICGSQVRMMQTMLVISFCWFICVSLELNVLIFSLCAEYSIFSCFFMSCHFEP